MAARLAAGSPWTTREAARSGRARAARAPDPRSDNGALALHAIHIDRFGNVQLNASHEELIDLSVGLGSRVELELNGGTRHAQYVRTFADVDAGALLLYEDAEGALAIAVSAGNAAERFGIAVGEQLRIPPA